VAVEVEVPSSLTRQSTQVFNDWPFLFVQRHSTLAQLFTLETMVEQLLLHYHDHGQRLAKLITDCFDYLVRDDTRVDDIGPGSQGAKRMERGTLFEVAGRN
jgi:hypothetical protein